MNKNIKKEDRLKIYMKALPKFFRGMIKRFLFAKVNGIIFIGKRVDLSHCNHIYCGNKVKFEDYSEIHGLSRNGLIFGNNVTIGRNSMIRPSSYYGNDLGEGIEIGDNSSIGPHAYIGCSGKIKIGNNVMMGPKCSLFAENHIFSDTEKNIKSQGVTQKGIIIEDDCWIGSNCVILDGVTIGKGSVIGAGTLITKDVLPNSIILDKREKLIRER